MLELIIPAIIGSLANEEDRIKGALLGGTLGSLTGGFKNPSDLAPVLEKEATAAKKSLPLIEKNVAGAGLLEPMVEINKKIDELGIKEKAPSGFDKILATLKDKPIESMQFLSALDGGKPEQQQETALPVTPLRQPSGFGDVPSVEESIGMNSSPRFVSKALFDDSKREVEEEEMALMYQKLLEAGLV